MSVPRSSVKRRSKLPVVGIGARGRADDLAEQVERKARLRRVQEIEVAEEGDLDPALALLAPQIDAEGIDDRSKPGGDDEGRALDQRLGLVRDLHEPRRRAHIGCEGRAARLGDAIDRLQHARIEQRIGQHDDVIAGLDRHDLVEIVGALDVARRVGLRDSPPGCGRPRRVFDLRMSETEFGISAMFLSSTRSGANWARAELERSRRCCGQSRAFVEDGSIGSLACTCARHPRRSMIVRPLARAKVAKQKADDDWERKAPRFRLGCARREPARRHAGRRRGRIGGGVLPGQAGPPLHHGQPGRRLRHLYAHGERASWRSGSAPG